MIEGTCKKIKKSLHFTGSGEKVYVEIGMEDVRPKVTAKTIIPFLKTLFQETIKELEDPQTPDTAPNEKEDIHEPSTEDAKEASTLSEKEFEKLMDNWLKKK